VGYIRHEKRSLSWLPIGPWQEKVDMISCQIAEQGENQSIPGGTHVGRGDRCLANRKDFRCGCNHTPSQR
jgi:hypothetical protein